LCLSQARTWISKVIQMLWSFFIFTDFESRGDCSICWYLWNCWRSLFKLSFYNSVETYNINFLRAISNTLCKRCPLWNVSSCVKCTVNSFFYNILDDKTFSVEGLETWTWKVRKLNEGRVSEFWKREILQCTFTTIHKDN
jgi:hypothetical protein